ncbi:MAG: chemotaxis protein CheW [Thiogranum sp.]
MADVNYAWLLKPAANLQIAVAEYQMAEYVIDPQVEPVPLAPKHCRSVLFWQDRIVPLMELARLAGNNHAGPVESVVVMAYQNRARAPLQYVAVAVSEPPSRIPVDDEQICELADDYADSLRAVTLSCFSHAGQPTAILNLERLSSADFRKLAAA